MNKLAIADQIEKCEILIEVYSNTVGVNSDEVKTKQEQLKRLNEQYLELMVTENERRK